MTNSIPTSKEEDYLWEEMNKPRKPVDWSFPRTDGGVTASSGYYSPYQKQPSPKKDAVNPDHYKRGDVECIDALRSALTPEEFRGYCKGSAMAYLWRMGKKDDATQEANKADWYVTWLQGKDPRL